MEEEVVVGTIVVVVDEDEVVPMDEVDVVEI